MEFKKESYLYRLAYMEVKKEERPASATLPRFVWNVATNGVIRSIGMFGCATLLIVVYSIGTPIMFFGFGYRPPFSVKEFKADGPFIRINRWPKWGGYHFMPVVVLTLLSSAVLVIIIVYILVIHVVPLVYRMISSSVLYSCITVGTMGLLVLIISLCAYRKTARWHRVKERINAQVKKLSPGVTFTDDSQKS